MYLIKVYIKLMTLSMVFATCAESKPIIRISKEIVDVYEIRNTTNNYNAKSCKEDMQNKQAITFHMK